MARVYNFSAGPATMPLPVLEEIQAELLDYKGSGMSVMEMSHRSKVFQQIADEAEADLRELMGIPDNYKVLFIQGGATLQFSMIPMNLMKNGVADYIVTGAWSKKAATEAKKFGKVNIVATSADKNFSYIPDCSDLAIDDDADYVYICENETIHGTTFQTLPNTKGKILVADQSSMFLSKPCNVSDYGMIYGGVQKNIGPAGLSIVIIREDLIREDIPENTPVYMRYEEKAAILYDFLDNSKMFHGTVEKEFRSLMNVPFVTGDADKDAAVVAATKAAGFDNLKGHKSVGGLRASIYNAMPIEGVKALVDFLKKYEEENA